MAVKKTPVQIMNAVRPSAFERLCKAMRTEFSDDEIFITGDSEIAVKIGVSPDDEPIYATYSPTVKNFTTRQTKSKTMIAYNAPKVAAKYAEKCVKREEEAKKDAELREKKKKKDAEAREKRAAMIAEAKTKKA